MNSLRHLVSVLLVGAALMTFFACNSKNSGDSADMTGVEKSSSPRADGESMAIRYYDLDTLMEKYNFARDVSEANLAASNKLDARGRQLQSEMQSLAQSIDNKLRNNGYASEDAYKKELAAAQNRESSAQNELASMQKKMVDEQDAKSKQLLDSINNFLHLYAELNHFDMIIAVSATQPQYINKNLDVTNDIVEGLNKRYNKVAAK